MPIVDGFRQMSKFEFNFKSLARGFLPALAAQKGIRADGIGR